MSADVTVEPCLKCKEMVLQGELCPHCGFDGEVCVSLKELEDALRPFASISENYKNLPDDWSMLAGPPQLLMGDFRKAQKFLKGIVW